MFEDAIRVLEEDNFIIVTAQAIRIITLGDSNLD